MRGGCISVLPERTRVEHRRFWDALPEILRIAIEEKAKPDGRGGAGGGLVMPCGHDLTPYAYRRRDSDRSFPRFDSTRPLLQLSTSGTVCFYIGE